MASQQAYNIGQVIYVLSNNLRSIVPAIISEEDTRKIKKLDGTHEITIYKVLVGPKDKRRTVELNKIDGEVFESLDSLKEHLSSNLMSLVNDLIKNAQAKVSNWYGALADNQTVVEQDDIRQGQTTDGKIDPEQLISSVSSEDRILASNINLSKKSLLIVQDQQDDSGLEELSNNTVRQTTLLKDKLKTMINDQQTEETEQTFVILPDGTKVPIKV